MEAGEWGVICSPGGSESIVGNGSVKLEITWRQDGGKTRLSIYGPLNAETPSMFANGNWMEVLEQDLLRSMHDCKQSLSCAST
jgi:hypothetical protein